MRRLVLPEEHVLEDGARILLRYIRPEDATELAAGFRALSPASRYRRFHAFLRELTPKDLRYFTCVDGQNHVAIVATTFGPDGAEHGVGVARFIRIEGRPDTAEVAMTVADPWQHRGVGRILGNAIARSAIEHAIRHLRGEIVPDNTPVRHLLHEAGATVRSNDDDGTFDIDLAPVASSL